MIKKVIFITLLSLQNIVFASEQSAKNLNVNQYSVCIINFRVYHAVALKQGNDRMSNAYGYLLKIWSEGGRKRFGEAAYGRAIEDFKNKEFVGTLSDKDGDELNLTCLKYDPLNWK